MINPGQIHCPNDETGVSQFIVLGRIFGQKVHQMLTHLMHFLTKRYRAKGVGVKVHFLHFLRQKVALVDKSAIYPGTSLSFRVALFGWFSDLKLSRVLGQIMVTEMCRASTSARHEKFSVGKFFIFVLWWTVFIFFLFFLFLWFFFEKSVKFRGAEKGVKFFSTVKGILYCWNLPF